MCGLFGWNFKRRSRLEIGKRECLASALAISNSTRGDKSWGVYAVSKDRPKGFIHKVPDDICKASGVSVLGRLPLVMGHTRAPTQGKICEKNAHPFQVGNIILSHNGVINNSERLDKLHNRSVDVDSEHLALHLSENKSFKDIEGYGVITWNDTKDPDTVFLCRLRLGSLSVYGIKNGTGEQVGVAWSSDKDHLKAALGMARMDCFPYKELEEGTIFYVNKGKLFTAESKLEISAPYTTIVHGGWSHGGYGGYGGSSRWDDRGFYVRKKGEDVWTWNQQPNGYSYSHDSD